MRYILISLYLINIGLVQLFYSSMLNIHHDILATIRNIVKTCVEYGGEYLVYVKTVLHILSILNFGDFLVAKVMSTNCYLFHFRCIQLQNCDSANSVFIVDWHTQES